MPLVAASVSCKDNCAKKERKKKAKVEQHDLPLLHRGAADVPAATHTHTHRLEILSDSFIYLFYLFSRRKNTHKGHEAVEMILSVLRKSD